MKLVESHPDLFDDPYTEAQDDLFALTCYPYRHTEVLLTSDDLGKIIL